MNDRYEILLGRPQVRYEAAERETDAKAEPRQASGWEAADGAGPDRLFNRYRRLRLDAWAAAGTDATLRCPAAPSAGRA
ncbi:hypothetical protein [Pseudoduganella albidiflava]|uniref:Uncharacterized protein n=1 Tax=Pseudoduganella albidiflava TaxID=321983 RepID=A0A411X759_9BURK|nr:hypothetical protein [Pseudoduganella albidiflava]QBI04744.1 hypothetical protein EYF70_30930 [Pseudoduganella albidiflava]GGY44422.1 hypothetical protein GCM10007387_27930 [Pseudoduganella albidiflava]